MKKNNLLLLLPLLLLGQVVFADDVAPPPGVPINDYVIVTAFLGVILVLAVFYKSTKIQSKKNINL